MRDLERQDTIYSNWKDLENITRDQMDFFFGCSGLLRRHVLPCASVFPPVRLLYVSLNLRKHQVSSWSKGQPRWPQTLQTHQMWCHIISIASFPYGLTLLLRLQIRPHRTRSNRKRRGCQEYLTPHFFKGLTSNTSVIHFTTGMVLESDFELFLSTMAKYWRKTQGWI